MPLRYFEFGTVFRYERAGTLHGMLRVRTFTQDDAHIFCTPEQYPAEIEGVFDFCCHVLDTFGFDYHVGLKTRGEKRIGSDEIWDMAEDGLRAVLEKRAAGKYCGCSLLTVVTRQSASEAPAIPEAAGKAPAAPLGVYCNTPQSRVASSVVTDADA